MEVQVHAKDEPIQRRWRTFIEARMAALERDFPELVRAQVSVARSRYRPPSPEVRIVADVPSATVRVNTCQPDVGSALIAALDGLARELAAYHAARKRFPAGVVLNGELA